MFHTSSPVIHSEYMWHSHCAVAYTL
jgi:hypothetical protein